jgi:PPOX class probable F420-dependent enzyme
LQQGRLAAVHIQTQKSMELSEREARERLAAARVARLATADASGRPHVVPFTFAAAGDLILHAVDHKPKRTTDLRRLRNLRENPRVSVLVDHYDEDWERLWWVRADGEARVIEGEAARAEPVRLLREKYPQYRELVPAGPVVEIRVTKWSGWAYRP